MTLTTAAFLFAVGIIAGFINALAGGSGFFVFPAFIAAGLPPISANASAFVSLAPANIVGFAANLPALKEAHHSLVMRSAIAVVGGVLGSLILIWTGPDAFQRAVPWLLTIATVLFALGPWLKASLEQNYGFQGHRFPLVLYGFEFVICVYGGYFGLGMGIVMLAIYELLGQDNLFVANAVKNFVITLVTLIGILLFAAAGLIAWMPAFVMGAGTAIGGYVSILLAERVSRRLLRNFILAWAVVLTIHAFAAYTAA
ncbi:MAG: sulfite exporter TauE/SafE family protein [Aestuariivirgaceae bacterium]